MKKLISVLLVLGLVLALTACTKSDGTTDGTTQENNDPGTDAAVSADDELNGLPEAGDGTYVSSLPWADEHDAAVLKARLERDLGSEGTIVKAFAKRWGRSNDLDSYYLELTEDGRFVFSKKDIGAGFVNVSGAWTFYDGSIYLCGESSEAPEESAMYELAPQFEGADLILQDMEGRRIHYGDGEKEGFGELFSYYDPVRFTGATSDWEPSLASLSDENYEDSYLYNLLSLSTSESGAYHYSDGSVITYYWVLPELTASDSEDAKEINVDIYDRFGGYVSTGYSEVESLDHVSNPCIDYEEIVFGDQVTLLITTVDQYNCRYTDAYTFNYSDKKIMNEEDIVNKFGLTEEQWLQSYKDSVTRAFEYINEGLSDAQKKESGYDEILYNVTSSSLYSPVFIDEGGNLAVVVRIPELVGGNSNSYIIYPLDETKPPKKHYAFNWPVDIGDDSKTLAAYAPTDQNAEQVLYHDLSYKSKVITLYATMTDGGVQEIDGEQCRVVNFTDASIQAEPVDVEMTYAVSMSGKVWAYSSTDEEWLPQNWR